ncbi:MAG TPA: hypothetical protein VKA37_12995 [Halobacteriales archaeon]|nr:hypothetical protein [Halobacteriales archaeon]
MADANTPRDLPSASAEVSENATSAFALLSSEGRLAILWTLWQAIEPGQEQTPISFTELAERCPYDSPGNLSYHLDKLVGEYVHKTASGYLLTGTGQKIVGAIRAGAMTRNVSFGPFEIDEPCPYCGGGVEASYSDNFIEARCTACGGTYPENGPGVLDHHPPGPGGVITHCEFPPAGVDARDPGESLPTYLTRAAFQAFSMLADACPECAAPVRVTTTLCSDHAGGDRPCETCGFRYAAQSVLACRHCKLQVVAATRWLPLSDPSVAAFFHERGVDASAGFSMELWAAMDDADVFVRSTDPVDLEIEYRLDGDTLAVGVDGTVSEIDVRG